MTIKKIKNSDLWPGRVVSRPTFTPSNSSAWRQIIPRKVSPLQSLPTGTSQRWLPAPPTPHWGHFPTPKRTNQVHRILWWCFSNLKGVKKKNVSEEHESNFNQPFLFPHCRNVVLLKMNRETKPQTLFKNSFQGRCFCSFEEMLLGWSASLL